MRSATFVCSQQALKNIQRNRCIRFERMTQSDYVYTSQYLARILMHLKERSWMRLLVLNQQRIKTLFLFHPFYRDLQQCLHISKYKVNSIWLIGRRYVLQNLVVVEGTCCSTTLRKRRLQVDALLHTIQKVVMK